MAMHVMEVDRWSKRCEAHKGCLRMDIKMGMQYIICNIQRGVWVIVLREYVRRLSSCCVWCDDVLIKQTCELLASMMPRL